MQAVAEASLVERLVESMGELDLPRSIARDVRRREER